MYILEVPHGVLYPEAHINRFKKKTGGDQPTTLERPRVFGRKPRTEGELGRERENMGRKGAWMKKSKARENENRKGARQGKTNSSSEIWACLFPRLRHMPALQRGVEGNKKRVSATKRGVVLVQLSEPQGYWLSNDIIEARVRNLDHLCSTSSRCFSFVVLLASRSDLLYDHRNLWLSQNK